MTATKKPRGRPRGFDPDEAVGVAQRLFQARGYDAVSVADLTDALGIKPPSFYAAFGSKAGLYARVLDRYSASSGVPLSALLRPDRPVAECLAAMLEAAARLYAADPAHAGCMVLEGTRCDDAQARAAALSLNMSAEGMIRDYIAARHPDRADSVADYVSTTMSGLSAKARNGFTLERLLESARLAGLAVKQALAE